MRILLRNRDTGAYYVRTGQWTPDPARAQSFDAGIRAIDCARTLNIELVEIIYEFPNPAFNHVIPIDLTNRKQTAQPLEGSPFS